MVFCFFRRNWHLVLIILLMKSSFYFDHFWSFSEFTILPIMYIFHSFSLLEVQLFLYSEVQAPFLILWQKISTFFFPEKICNFFLLIVRNERASFPSMFAPDLGQTLVKQKIPFSTSLQMKTNCCQSFCHFDLSLYTCSFSLPL